MTDEEIIEIAKRHSYHGPVVKIPVTETGHLALGMHVLPVAKIAVVNLQDRPPSIRWETPVRPGE